MMSWWDYLAWRRAITDGIDHGLYDLTDGLLHVEADEGEVGDVPLVDVGEVVGHKQLVQAVFVTGEVIHTRPAKTMWVNVTTLSLLFADDR